jgi:hypothetical protein
MNVSTVAPPPIAIVVPSYENKPQNSQTQNKDTDPTHQPQPPVPLPPGQGTRIDQIA